MGRDVQLQVFELQTCFSQVLCPAITYLDPFPSSFGTYIALKLMIVEQCVPNYLKVLFITEYLSKLSTITFLTLTLK